MERLKDIVLINLGLIMVAIGIYFFKIPNHFAIGGVSGIAIIITHYLPFLSVGPLLFIINSILVVLGFIFLGFKFTSKSIYSSVVLSSLVWVLEKVIPIQGSITSEPMLDLIFAVFLPGIGAAIVFNQRTSTGGTDIVAKILNKYMHMNIGKTLLLSDFGITIIAGMTFGIRIGLFSILGLFIKGFLIDTIIESINLNKQVVIVSDEYEQIKKFILKNMNRSATIHKAYGAYTGEEKEVITTILSRRQAVILRDFVRSVDPIAFLAMTNTSEIVGRGFRNADL